MYSVYKLNKQVTIYSLDVLLYLTGTSFFCSMSSSNCCFLICIHVSQEADQVVWYSHLFHNFPQFIVIHTVKGFGTVNKAEIDVFLDLSCFSKMQRFLCLFYFFPFIFISWRLITLQYCSGFCHTLTWISHGITCIPHPDPPSLFPPHPIPLGLPSAPALSTCLMHLTWAGDLFHPWYYTCFDAVLSKHPTLTFSHRVQKSFLYICVSFSVLHIGLSLTSF